ncbi:MAG: glutathione S-transferase N-terminal domain-containing protein [Rubrivivax sp.]|nr:glutathione S-transferase N-terminal domain-containing protein [Rubrivivax sp.]
MIRLLGRFSSINVRKVSWTLHELGLPFQREDWGAGFRATDDPAFLALNPHAQVPVLVDDRGDRDGRGGDVVLWESNTICRYLAARECAEALLPPDPLGRARVEQWMDWQASDLNAAWRDAFMALVRGSAAHADPARVAASAAAWNRGMAVLDAQLERTGAYVAGAGFTLADIVIGLSVHRWRCTPIEHARLPAVEAYAGRLRERKAYAAHASDDLP